MTGLGLVVTEILTIIITTLIVENRRSIADIFSRLFSSTPQVDRFEKLIKSTYRLYPSRRPQCYVREDYTPKEGDIPTYHFFINENVEIQEFMAFLLPSLDYGHGLKAVQVGNGVQYRFNYDWDDYLRKIAAKVKRARTRPFTRAKEDLDIPIGSRIVFFDKKLLLMFLFDHEWIYKTRDSSGSPSDQFAKAVIEYAAYVFIIHNRMRLYDAIECRYVAESVVVASDYYDFGFYRIEGVPIIYAPIHKKDNHNRIRTEKVFIGDIVRQRRRIEEFVIDYKRLWRKAEEVCRAEEGRKGAITETDLNSLDGDPYKLNYLTSEIFEKIYCDRIYEILHEKSGVVRPPPFDLPEGEPQE